MNTRGFHRLLPFLAALASVPAAATGGMQCKTADGSEVVVTLVIGHVAGGPLSELWLTEKGKRVPVQASQYWLDDDQLQLVIANEDFTRIEAELNARRSDRVYDGSIKWRGKSRWIRCRES